MYSMFNWNALPLSFEQENLIQGTYFPTSTKNFNNDVFCFWQRSLFQRAISAITFDGMPEEWSGPVKDFFNWCLFRIGFLGVFETDELGLVFQPCTLKGYDFYYQPTGILVNNPLMQDTEFKLGTEAELIKLTPDYMGIFDVVAYYAEKLALLDSAINMSIINNKVAFILGGKNKAVIQALQKIMDKVNRGEPAVFYDSRIADDPQSKDSPFQEWKRDSMKQNYLTTDQLKDFQTIINNFDAEVGIPTIPYEKAERMVTDEATSRTIDGTARARVWIETLNSSFENVNKHFGINLNASLTYEMEAPEQDTEEQEEGTDYGES